MPHFGPRSLERLATLEPRLEQLMRDAIKVCDFAIICGHRSQAAQDEAYATGASKVQWPDSLHNSWPSRAVDVAPWPIDWADSLAFARLAGVLDACAAQRGIPIRWGGDWDRDGSSRDQSFMDIGHFELVEG